MNELHQRFAPALKTLSVEGPGLGTLRQTAFDEFTRAGFPTLKDEAWKYTNVAPIAQTAFALPMRDGSLTRAALEKVAGPAFGARAVFVNGWFHPELSSLQAVEGKLVFASLASALDKHRDKVEPAMSELAKAHPTSFSALNSALMQDGALLWVPARTVIETPVELLFVSVGGGGQPWLASPRLIIVAEQSAQVSLVEHHLSVDPGAVYLTNAVTQLVLGANAVVRHEKLQREGPGAYHVALLQATCGRDSQLSSSALMLGGSIARNEIRAHLGAEGAQCDLLGLYLGQGSQLLDNYTVVDHAMPHCQSRELYKGVLDDRSHGVFSGRVVVREHAQKTDASQTNKNLLLSEQALVDTKPQLEIFADDVKCAHGATVGQLDEDALFYLRSRGIDRASARSLLTLAFVSEVLAAMPVAEVRARAQGWVEERLLKGGAPWA